MEEALYRFNFGKRKKDGTIKTKMIIYAESFDNARYKALRLLGYDIEEV